MSRDSKGRYVAGVEISVIDSTLGPLRRIMGGLGGLEAASRKASRALDFQNLENLGSRVSSFVAKPIKKFADFEEQMDSVTAATFDLTKALEPDEVREMNEAVAQLSTTARQLGADTKYSATEAAAGMDILAKNFAGADMEKAQAVVDAMPGILDTAAATKETIETAADVSTATMNQFGLAAKDMGIIGDVLVKTANNSATGLVDLGEALKYSGVTAHKAGVDLETTTAMIGALGNAGKKGSVAGTGLASVLSNVQSGAKKQRSALAALGIDVTDKKGNLKPIVELLAELDKAADKKFGGKGKGGVKRDRWLQGLVGMGGDKEALAILMEQAGSGELQKLVAANKEAEGTANLVATAMSDNMAGAAGELDGALEELQLTMGETVVPTITETLKWAKEATVDFTAWAKENPELTRALGALAVALGVVATVTRAVTFAMMVNPIVAIVTGIAMAAYLIYEHWEPIKDWFVGLWDSITAPFKSTMDWILEQIGWVGEKVEAFKISIMTPAEAEAYAAQKAGEVEAAARAATNTQHGSLFADDLDAAGSLTRRGGLDDAGGGWQTEHAANNDKYVADELERALASALGQDMYGPAAPTALAPEEIAATRQQQSVDFSQLMLGMEKFRAVEAANGPALLDDQDDGGAASAFDGKLMITVNSEGKVTKTSMTSEGDPNFAVRMNAGGQ